jgi:hypothetical protein
MAFETRKGAKGEGINDQTNFGATSAQRNQID